MGKLALLAPPPTQSPEIVAGSGDEIKTPPSRFPTKSPQKSCLSKSSVITSAKYREEFESECLLQDTMRRGGATHRANYTSRDRRPLRVGGRVPASSGD